ncbi:MAG: SdrD B-like domain-containing protein [bacterium]
MKTRSIFTAIALAVFFCFMIITPASADNVQVLSDPQEIASFLSGYDIQTVTFTLDSNDTMTIDIKPYGVPGDADGDGFPDTSSNQTILDEPGVGYSEDISTLISFHDTAYCSPDVYIDYTDNTLSIYNLFGPDPIIGPTMTVTATSYVLTIPNYSAFRALLGGNPGDFGAFGVAGSSTDQQTDDMVPDSGCGIISITPVVANVSLGDFVWGDSNGNGLQDAGEPGLDNVTVNLLDCNNNMALVDTTTTVSGGSYTFANEAPGIYSVEFTAPAGYVFTTKDVGGDDTLDSDADQSTGRTACTEMIPGDTNLTLDAGLFQTASIGNLVWHDLNRNGIQDSGEPGLDGVTVNLYDNNGNLLQTITTAGGGIYQFSGMNPGSYVVEVVPPSGYVFSDQYVGTDAAVDSNVSVGTGKSDAVVLTSGQADASVDAGLNQLPASIGNYVWNDLNANGLQDGLEPGIQGVAVNLYDSSNVLVTSTTTDVNGIYAFSNLDPGTYVVEFVYPSGFVFSPKDAGTNDAIDSDADTTTGRTATITLAPNESNLDADAGLYQKASIGDLVWDDTDMNGIQNTGEPGISNATVNLYRCSDNIIVAAATTNGSGNYLFPGQEPGSYYIGFVAPSGYVFTLKDQGGDDTIDSDADPVTGQTVCVTLNSGDNNTSVDAGLFVPAVPEITMKKFTNNQDADQPTGPNIAVGSVVTWEYVVTNSGNVALTNVGVTDDKGVVVTCPGSILAPTATMTCTATGTAVAGQYSNIGTASGTAPSGVVVTATDPSHYFGIAVQAGGQGCSDGFWKNHTNKWPSPYTPSTMFSAVFENAFPGKTLLQVISQGGGGLTALGRQTVGALLNAAATGVSYDLTPAQVISQFNAVFPGSCSSYEPLKNSFEQLNEQGCPISGGRTCEGEGKYEGKEFHEKKWNDKDSKDDKNKWGRDD